jgi:3-hydroxyisobutyrate dehydrogenase-like beta-hydroxyacid dehydrogenase
MKIGFIGAGMMGRPIVDRLVAAGHDVTILARNPQTQAQADADGLTWAQTAVAAARDADVVFSVVLNDDQIRSVFLGPEGVIAAMKPGATIVQHTTSDPSTAHLLADEGAVRDVTVLDAALSGGPPDIAAGQLTLWVGGDEALLDAMRPVLATYASPIMFVGPLGNGQRVKLVNNALFVAQVGLAIDAVRLAGSLGIEENAILGAVTHGSGTSRGLTVVAGMGSVDAVGDRLAHLMLKDVTVVRDVAQRMGADLGVIGTVLSSDAVEKKVLRRF